MPKQTKIAVRGRKQATTAGTTELKSSKVTARSIRAGLQSNLFAMKTGRPPEPPQEWSDWKRDNMAVCIRAAWLFMRGKSIVEIASDLDKRLLTRQAVSFLISKGTAFLLDRRFITVVN